MSTSDFLERGSFEFEKGNFKQAEEHLTAVIKADNNEDKLDAYRMRASCRHEMKQYQDAIVDAKRLLELNPKSTSGYALWGCALSKLGKFEEALATFRLGLDIDTNDSELKKGLKDMQVEIMSSANYIEEKTYDAVKMSSQDSYPGDSELEVLEKEIMQKWGMTEFPPFEVFMQDPKMAVKEYGAALQLRKAGNDDQALQKMKVCIKLCYFDVICILKEQNLFNLK
jgi:tetratricopeptide (TPR) repeat protein